MGRPLNAARRRRSLSCAADCRKSLAEFFCLGEKIILIVFCGDMCVAENTSHGAKCRIVRLWRTTEAWSEVQSFFVEEGYVFFDKLRAPEIPAPFAVDKAARRAYNVQQDRKGRKARC